MPALGIEEFFSWFQLHGGYVDTNVMDIVDLPPSEGGRGAVALKDIPEGYTVFATPCSLVLGARTSTLPIRFGMAAWKNLKLNQRWSGIILCIMWEAALGTESKWSKYFDTTPNKFNVPMFWDEEDLAELKGTAVVGWFYKVFAGPDLFVKFLLLQEKLGKEEAENDYREKILPAIQSRPDLFKPSDLSTRYSLTMYHTMGTLLTTRSFTLEKEEDQDDVTMNESRTSDMDADHPNEEEQNPDASQDEELHDDDEEEDNEVVVVPLADLFNARYKQNNVKLFCEPDCFRMVSSKPIKAGEQIWNTYGDRPNSDLLRGLGYVDYIPLPAHLFGENLRGNPGDVVEIRADVVVTYAIKARADAVQENDLHDRIDWWLEEGGDDMFALEVDSSTTSPSALELPPALVSFTRLILFDSEWERSRSKGKAPRPRAERQTLRVIKTVLEKRLKDYTTTLEEDEHTLSSSFATLALNKRNALIVRVGEKRILHIYLKRLDELLAEVEEPEAGMLGNGKRKAVIKQETRKRKRH